MVQINATKLGLAAGILWGFIMLTTTWLSVGFGYGTSFLNLFVDLYPGFSISLLGSLVGAIYAFIDAFIGGFLLGWIYNKLAKE